MFAQVVQNKIKFYISVKKSLENGAADLDEKISEAQTFAHDLEKAFVGFQSKHYTQFISEVSFQSRKFLPRFLIR